MKATIAVPMSNEQWVEVEAELLFKIAPHLAHVATFAVHASPDTYPQWCVTNVETGMYLEKAKSRRAAIRTAGERLAKMTTRDFDRAYDKALGSSVLLRNGSA